MVIKSSNGYLLNVCFFFFVAIFVYIELGSGILSLSIIAFAIHEWILYDREFTMNEEGCTVRFLWMCRFYRWDEFKVKKYVDYRPLHTVGSYTYGVMIFSPYKVNWHGWPRFEDYCSFRFHIFSCVFVNFKPTWQTTGREYSDVYPVNEIEFRRKLDEWGVDLTA